MEETAPGMRAGYGKTVEQTFDSVVSKVEEALLREGFGILSRIDVKETLKAKLGVEMPPFLILGACNPSLAHRAMTVAPEIGVMLPCNVVVRQVEEGGTRVEVVDSETMSALFPQEEISEVAREVKSRLDRVLDAELVDDPAVSARRRDQGLERRISQDLRDLILYAGPYGACRAVGRVATRLWLGHAVGHRDRSLDRLDYFQERDVRCRPGQREPAVDPPRRPQQPRSHESA